MSERRLAIPCLTGSEPLELLLEIGLEKLTKDYEYIFSESKICSVDDLGINKRLDLWFLMYSCLLQSTNHFIII